MRSIPKAAAAVAFTGALVLGGGIAAHAATTSSTTTPTTGSSSDSGSTGASGSTGSGRARPGTTVPTTRAVPGATGAGTTAGV